MSDYNLQEGDEVEIVVQDGYKYLDLGNGNYALLMDENGNPAKDEIIH